LRCIAVMGGHGRCVGEPLDVADDVGVLAVDDVLVAQRGGGEAWPIRVVSAFSSMTG